MSKSQLKTDWVCIATAGSTVDGREISSQDLVDMAQTYNPETYTALIWWEHYRFFGNLGQVLSLKVEEVNNQTKLFAELRPTAELLEYNQAGQKVFTSIEIMPNFAKTGKAYLGGLAVTDSPASIGTTQLNFSAKGMKETNLIIGNKEIFHFSIADEKKQHNSNHFFNALMDVFKKFTQNSDIQERNEADQLSTELSSNNNNNKEAQPMKDKQFNQLLEAVAILSQRIDEKFSQLAPQATEQTQQTETVKTVSAEEFAALSAKFYALEQKFNALSNTEVTPIPAGQGDVEQQFNMAV